MLRVLYVIKPNITPAGIADKVSIIGLPNPAIDVWISAEISVVINIEQTTPHFCSEAKYKIPLNKNSQPM